MKNRKCSECKQWEKDEDSDRYNDEIGICKMDSYVTSGKILFIF